MRNLPLNPKRNEDHGTQGYKDLGWQNGWKAKYKEEDGKKVFDRYEDQPEYSKCRESEHKTREVDISLYQFRGTDNIVICDECKILSHYDCSD